MTERRHDERSLKEKTGQKIEKAGERLTEKGAGAGTRMEEKGEEMEREGRVERAAERREEIRKGG